MEAAFEIPVTYNNQLLLFPARLVQTGYIHQFEVLVNGHSFLFEKDDEERYRAIAAPATIDSVRHIDTALLGAIAEAIEEILR